MFNAKELKVIDAANVLFKRHGFRRVTMHDIAVAVEMSRPALYLVFPNKEVIFEAVVRHNGAQTLARIRDAIGAQKSTDKQLRAAFDFWAIQPFEAIQQSPDARDLIECTHGFASAAMAEVTAGFEEILREILSPIAPRRGTLDARSVASLLIAAVGGFKMAVTDVADLRALIERQITLVLAALQAPG
jgi:AcrR family transcriptional regulator